ncbi:TPA: hypothetical protein ACGSTL_001351 [Vibrio parahaemolyticus]|uniref:hypothetical protein n=1 Tax=Vibrio campbellii TaxID=680 RepID=UPI001F07C22D|nr:hypothetical protein [Vibrio campbellii]UMM06796.1 hypothetical protein MKR81_26410 [Vibrio campbellii]
MSETMTKAEYNQFVIDHVVDHVGDHDEEECPACGKQAIRHDFECCHSGSVNQHYTLDCDHCGYHICDQDECGTCEAAYEASAFEYEQRMDNAFKLEALAELALENACTGVTPAIFTNIKEMLYDDELDIEFDCFCFTDKRLHRGNFMDRLVRMIMDKRFNVRLEQRIELAKAV